MNDFIGRVEQYMARCGMPAPGARVLVTLSGGADSVALLLVLRSLGYDCVAAHCNFHLRGEESMRDEKFVRGLCADLGLQLKVKDFNVKERMKVDGVSVEMACRDLRYEWFEHERQSEQCCNIAVAHHSDDNVETLLLNMLRGTGIAGMAGIKPVNGYIIRPLLCVSRQEIEEFLSDNGRTLSRRIWIPDNKRATGLFVYDVAIDLRTLFCVSMNQHEPEVSKEMIDKLKSNGWVESENVFGKCLVLPKAEREKIIPALADALIDWRITSNQARTFSLMETLAIAVSANANTIAAAIRAKLMEDGDRPNAKPIVDANAGADLFVALPCASYMITERESSSAIEDAKQNLIQRMMAFDYEHQTF